MKFNSTQHKEALKAIKNMSSGDELSVSTRFNSAGSLDVLWNDTEENLSSLLYDIMETLDIDDDRVLDEHHEGMSNYYGMWNEPPDGVLVTDFDLTDTIRIETRWYSSYWVVTIYKD